MKILGQAVLGGWVRDTRVVGDVLYAVTEQYPYDRRLVRRQWRSGDSQCCIWLDRRRSSLKQR